MKQYVIEKKLINIKKSVYYNKETKKFDGYTFTVYKTLSEVSMVLVHLTKTGVLDNVETSDVSIKEIELWN